MTMLTNITLAATFAILLGAMMTGAVVSLAQFLAGRAIIIARDEALRWMGGAIVAALLALAAVATAEAAPIARVERGASLGEPAQLRPATACLRSPACRTQVAEQIAALSKKAAKQAWDKVETFAEQLGQLADAFERGRSNAEIRERLDRIERALADRGRLTPEIQAEFRAIRVRLDGQR